MNNSRQAIKHIELMQEQIQALEQQNTELKEQLNTAICLLCSNKAKVTKQLECVDDPYYTYSLYVEDLNGVDSGTFSPEATPYQAVLTGIDEYIEYIGEI